MATNHLYAHIWSLNYMGNIQKLTITQQFVNESIFILELSVIIASFGLWIISDS